MKFVMIAALIFTLNSCNTLIGIGRDTQQGYEWTKGKIQGTGGGSQDSSGAPVY